MDADLGDNKMEAAQNLIASSFAIATEEAKQAYRLLGVGEINDLEDDRTFGSMETYHQLINRAWDD